MTRMTAPETVELFTGMISDQAYDMINEYDGEEDIALCENTTYEANVARITLDNGRVIIVTVTTDDTNYK